MGKLRTFDQDQIATIDRNMVNQLVKSFHMDMGWKYASHNIGRATIAKSLEALRWSAPLFCVFWCAYPRHENPPAAIRAFMKSAEIYRNQKEFLAIVMEGLHLQFKDRQEAASRGLFYPEWKHPSTWLNACSWEDSYRAIKRPPPEEPDMDLVWKITEWHDHLLEQRTEH